MPDKHAFLSPSSAERWVHCPPSAWLSEQFPDQGSVFASEGTEAHRLCEYLLHRELGIPDTDPRPSLKYYTEEMEEAPGAMSGSSGSGSRNSRRSKDRRWSWWSSRWT